VRPIRRPRYRVQQWRRDKADCIGRGGVALIASLRPANLIGVGLGIWQPLTRPSGVSAHARYVETFKRSLVRLFIGPKQGCQRLSSMGRRRPTDRLW
jgi:hypothetical protein